MTRRRFGLEFDDRVPNDEEQQLDSAVEMLHKSFNPTPNRFSGRDLVEELIFSKDSHLAWDARCTIERNNKAITVVAKMFLLRSLLLARESNDR